MSLVTQRGIEDIVAEEVTLLPGLEEGAHLLWINQYYEENEFDVLVVDAAPTAETLRLLSLPDATRWWLEKNHCHHRRTTRAHFTPLKQTSPTGAEMPDNDAIQAVKNLFDTLDKVRDLMSDPTMSSIRLVVNAERMVIKKHNAPSLISIYTAIRLMPSSAIV